MGISCTGFLLQMAALETMFFYEFPIFLNSKHSKRGNNNSRIMKFMIPLSANMTALHKPNVQKRFQKPSPCQSLSSIFPFFSLFKRNKSFIWSEAVFAVAVQKCNKQMIMSKFPFRVILLRMQKYNLAGRKRMCFSALFYQNRCLCLINTGVRHK